MKDLTRRTASDKILRDKLFNIAKNPKHDGCQRGIASTVYKSFDKKSTSLADKSPSRSGIENENISNKEIAEELHKPIIKKFKKRKVHLSFIYKIWGADLSDMQLIVKFYKVIRFLLCAIDIFSKYAITIAFQKILKESSRKPHKIWVDRSMKPFLQNNDLEMYSTHNEGKCCC